MNYKILIYTLALIFTLACKNKETKMPTEESVIENSGLEVLTNPSQEKPNIKNLGKNQGSSYTNSYAKKVIQTHFDLSDKEAENIVLLDFELSNGDREWSFTIYLKDENGKNHRLSNSLFRISRSGGPDFPDSNNWQWTEL